MSQTLHAALAWVRNQFGSSPQHEKYIGVSGNDVADSADEVEPATRSHRGVKPWLVAAFVALGGIFVLTFILLLKEQPISEYNEEYPCGSTPAEADTHGCVFDTMLYGWTHPKCFDKELMERYLHDGNWTWRDDPQHEAPFSDATITGVDTKEQAKRGLWASRPDGSGRWVNRWEFHLVHCAYAWELVERAYYREDVYIYRELTGENAVEHAEHCGERWAEGARQGLDPDSREFIQTKVGKGPPPYYTCMKLQGRRGSN
jgi:hypothetical protein